MGLIVYVLRNTLGDCTLGGISSATNKLCIVNVDGPFEPDAEMPAAMLVKGYITGTAKVIPAQRRADGSWEPKPGWHMAGGNYAETSDSRWSQAVGALTSQRFPVSSAIAIHDRCEEYNVNGMKVAPVLPRSAPEVELDKVTAQRDELLQMLGNLAATYDGLSCEACDRGVPKPHSYHAAVELIARIKKDNSAT